MGVLCCLFIIDFFAIITLLNYAQGHSQVLEQCFAFCVGLCRCNECNVKASCLFHLVVHDFGENKLFTDTQCVVSTTVEIGVYATEVTDSGNAMLTSLSKKEYIRSPRRVTFAPTAMPFLTLKFATDSLLLVTRVSTGNCLQFLHCKLEGLGVVFYVAQTGVQNDFSSLGTSLMFL